MRIRPKAETSADIFAGVVAGKFEASDSDGAPTTTTTMLSRLSMRLFGGKSFIGLLAGLAVGGIVAFATGGIGMAALGAFVIVANAVNFFLGPKGGAMSQSVASPQALSRPTNANGREQAAQQMEISAASEAIAIPVVFGRNRMTGNYLRCDRSTFRSVPIVERTKIEQVVQKPVQQASQGGGKGGGGADANEQPSSGATAEDRRVSYQEKVTGYHYYVSMEFGICAGTVTEVHEIKASPGNESLLSSQVDDTESIVLTLAGQESGGTVRLYKGSRSQSRETGEVYTVAGGDNHYRGTCFALFENFKIGTSATPPNYTFEITRLPDPRDDDEATIATIVTRGGAQFAVSAIASDGTKWTVTSAANTFKIGDEVRIASSDVSGYDGVHIINKVNSTTEFEIVNTTNIASATTATVHHLSYEDANPAAILWEVLTNKQWGRGESVDKLNQASFESASNYFADHNIGMSFRLESQDVVSDAIEAIRLHVNTVLTWDGLEVRCLALDDRSTAYSPIIAINRENCKDLQHSRPTWYAVTNELRAEFTNRQNNYQPELVSAFDLAASVTSGTKNSDKLALKAFSVRSVAEPQLRRILYDMSYPKARLSFRMNEFERRLVPGDFVRLDWNEFEDEETHNFWRVLTIDDSGQHEEGIMVELMEDPYAVGYSGALEEFVAPVPFTDTAIGTSITDAYLGEDFSERYPAGTFNPARIDNLSIFVTAGSDAVALGLNRSSLHNVGVDLFWKKATEAASAYKKVGFFAPWAATGILRTDIPKGRFNLDRSTTFDFILDNELHATAMLASANKVVIDSDDFEEVINANTDLIRVNDETILCGSIVDTGTTFSGSKVYRASNLVRGHYGTVRRKHYATETMAYSDTFAKPTHMVPRGAIEEFFPNLAVLSNPDPVDLRASPISPRGAYPAASDYEFTGEFTGLGSDAFAPGLVSATFDDSAAPGTGVGIWTVKIRPRWHNSGAGIISTIGDSWRDRVEEIEPGYSFWWRQTGSAPIRENLPFLLWLPDSVEEETFPGATADQWRIRGIKVNNETFAKVTPTWTADDGATREAGVATLVFSGGNSGFEIRAVVNGKTKPGDSIFAPFYSLFVMVGPKSVTSVSMTPDVLDVYELNEKLEVYQSTYIAP